MLLPLKFCLRFLLGILLLLPMSSWAGTVVRVNSPLGEFYIELLDDSTPVTAENFLHYVNSGLYNGTVIHRLVPGFVIQGGWLTFDQSIQTFFPIATRGNIQNEYRVSNQRGTLAMAKQGGDPNSANSQWFINLGDNSFLDSQNGGFTVFARVMGDGMQVVDAIAALPPLQVLQGMDPFPAINYAGGPLLDSHLVRLSMSVVGSTDNKPAVFQPDTGRLSIYVDAGDFGLLSVAFQLISEEPQILIKIDPDRLFPIDQPVADMPIFDGASGRLTIPELWVDGQVAYRNVRFLLSDEEQLVFTLEGAD
jgi:peptidyl-prolyl cis-trans isomerase A (cyclophilin A)